MSDSEEEFNEITPEFIAKIVLDKTFTNLTKDERKQLIETLLNLEELNLTNCGIHKIDNLEVFSKLKILNLSDNHIQQLENLEFLLSLEELDVSSNELHSLCDLSSLINLKKLKLNDNQNLIMVDPNKLPHQLVELDLINTPLMDIFDYSSLPKLLKFNNLVVQNNDDDNDEDNFLFDNFDQDIINIQKQIGDAVEADKKSIELHSKEMKSKTMDFEKEIDRIVKNASDSMQKAFDMAHDHASERIKSTLSRVDEEFNKEIEVASKIAADAAKFAYETIETNLEEIEDSSNNANQNEDSIPDE
eukprot:TRINITY_DN3418_c0_g1_i1.p1 TRINITY_DN3418_c0_g1~~TRINITY_DN3418_c0_g1_i1.p1  ORF type:complete len:303 (+),score=133.11 TRINITY_DN3418_c0_g1_i1:56-964(+)